MLFPRPLGVRWQKALQCWVHPGTADMLGEQLVLYIYSRWGALVTDNQFFNEPGESSLFCASRKSHEHGYTFYQIDSWVIVFRTYAH